VSEALPAAKGLMTLIGWDSLSSARATDAEQSAGERNTSP